MWIGSLWVGLQVAMWITHVGGKFRHGLLEKSLILGTLLRSCLAVGFKGRKGSKRVPRRGSKKGLSRRPLEGRNKSFQEYDPPRLHPMSAPKSNEALRSHSEIQNLHCP